ncbi:MAG: DUF362 domain-containing protein [Deltaproteobacteria bacterium]|jgi:thiamine pyrophosphate-dependent acetolactate synthase large subunit-like protein/uncharacterized protein (DUF362 family)|nr:DUF362 domain-containing protein [Deltaproteobacteria bacterium]
MGKSLVSIVRYEKPLESVGKAVDLSKGLDHLPAKARVFIKPNIVFWIRTATFPKWGTITTSRVVEDIVILLKERGIDEITIGEGIVLSKPRDRETPAHAFESLGYCKLQKKYGVKCIDIHQRPFEKVDFGGGVELNYNSDILECDFVVNLPVLKTHLQTVVSLGIKNLKGLIDIESRKKCHNTDPGMDLHDYVAKLANKIPPSLTVIDGIYSNELGPHFTGNMRRSNLLIASADMLAADMVGAKILGYEPSQVPYLKLAAEDRQRPTDLSDVKPVGEKIEAVASYHEYVMPYDEEKKLPVRYVEKGIEGLKIGDVDLSVCTYCAEVLPVALPFLSMAWKGEPWDDVEVLFGKVQQPTPGRKKTILFGKCMYEAHKDNADIQEMINVKGCPPSLESIRKAFDKAGIDLGPLFGNREALLSGLMRRYKGRPEFDESFFTIEGEEPDPQKAEKKDVALGKREYHPSAGALFAEGLKEHGTEVAFGVHGGELSSIIDAASRKGIKLISVRHEQTAVYAAEAYSKVTGNTGVFYANSGPGAANLASALQQCYLSCSPAVGIVGGTMAGHERSYTLLPFYAEHMFSRITKWTQRISGDYSVKHFVSKAFKDAQAYPKGPCVIEFPYFSMAGTTTPPNLMTMTAQMLQRPKWRGEQTGKPMPQPGGDPGLIEEAVGKICQAKKPLILAGDGVHWSGAGKELAEFAELAQLLVTGRRIGRGAMPETHPNHIGWRLNRKELPECDLLVLIGMKVGMTDSGFGRGWPKCIQINESPEHIWEYLKTDMIILGGAKVVLKQMIQCLKANQMKPAEGRREWIRRVQQGQKEYDAKLAAKAMKYQDNKPIHHGWLCKALWDACEELHGGMNRIVVDGFTVSGFIPPFPKARFSGQILDASEHAGVGHGIGMAIGAALGDPETRNHPIIALMGDGGIGIAGFDIETARRYELPIVYLVTNNDGWLTGLKSHFYGKEWQALGPQDRPYGHEFLPGIKYDKLSEVFDVHGEFVEEPGEFRPALERALRSAQKGRTAVVNVRVDPTLVSPAMHQIGIQAQYGHIPWEELPKRGKALRRFYHFMFPWDEAGEPPVSPPDTWDPVSDDEMEP